MAKAAFLYNNLAAGLTPTADSSGTISGLGWDKLNDPQPRHRARVNDTDAILVFDLGAAAAVDVLALLSTSLISTATARVRASTADPECLATLLYDSGVLSNVTTDEWNGNIVHCLPAAATARYWRWDITGVAPIDIGLAPLGLLFRPGRNFSYGAREGRVDPSESVWNVDTGSRFGVRLPSRRVKEFQFNGLSKAEIRVSIDAMERLAGVAGDLLFIEDPDASAADLARDSIWGAMRVPGGADLSTRIASQIWARPFRIEERA